MLYEFRDSLTVTVIMKGEGFSTQMCILKQESNIFAEGLKTTWLICTGYISQLSNTKQAQPNHTSAR